MIQLVFARDSKAKTMTILRMAIASWRDSLSVIDSAAILFATVVTILFGLNYFALGRWTSETSPLLLMLLSFGLFLGQPLVLSPLAIVVHRSLLLGKEDTSFITGYRRYARFFTYVVAMLIIFQVPFVILELGFTGGAISLMTVAGTLLLLLALGVLVRSLLLFPALAIDAPGARWRNALKDSKGHGWHIFLLLMCTIMPLLLMATALSSLMEAARPVLFWEFIALELRSIGVAITTIVVAATASRLYKCYADYLGRPANLR